MVLVGNTGYSASFKRCQKNFYHAFNRSFAEHAEHSAAPKGRLGTGCMQPAVADDKGDLGSDGRNAGKKTGNCTTFSLMDIASYMTSEHTGHSHNSLHALCVAFEIFANGRL